MRSVLGPRRKDKPARTVYVGSHEDKLTRTHRMKVDPDENEPVSADPGPMHPLLRARVWFAVTAVLGVVGLFVLDGAAAGGVCAAAMATFIFACFRGLSGESPEDRTAGTGIFGGGGPFGGFGGGGF